MAAVPSIGRASLVEASPRAARAAAETAEGLYECYAPKIMAYCRQRLGSPEEAEDAVQTTFMNAFRALRRGVVPQSEAAWLYAIAENVCLSRHRSSGRRRRVESSADLELVEHVVPAPGRDADELIGLEDALAALPEQQRRAILLREWQGLSYREVAEELALSQSAVETLIFRARRSLAQGLERPASRRPRLRRVLHALDLAPLLGALKTLLAGGAAAKATAAAVAVTATVTVAGASGPTAAPPSTNAPPSAVAAGTPGRAPARSAPALLAPALERPAGPERDVRTAAATPRAAPAKAKAAKGRAATPGSPAQRAHATPRRGAVAPQGVAFSQGKTSRGSSAVHGNAAPQGAVASRGRSVYRAKPAATRPTPAPALPPAAARPARVPPRPTSAAGPKAQPPAATPAAATAGRARAAEARGK